MKHLFRSNIEWKKHLSEIRQMSLEGMTLSEIGEHFGVSRQRIKQVMNKYDLRRVGETHGKHVLVQHKQEEYKNKWGISDSRIKKSFWYRRQLKKFSEKKYNALRDGREWSIQLGDLDFPSHCPVLGIELDYDVRHLYVDNMPSFDRIDSTKDYIKGNVAIISWRANRIKNDGTAEEHRKIADFIDKNLTPY